MLQRNLTENNAPISFNASVYRFNRQRLKNRKDKKEVKRRNRKKEKEKRGRKWICLFNVWTSIEQHCSD